MAKWYGREKYTYKVMKGATEIYRCVSVADDQDSVLTQLEAICGRIGRFYWVYCNGKKIGQLRGLKLIRSVSRINSQQIKCRETGVIYQDLNDMMEQTGFDYKHCSYLVNRTTRYSYID